MDNQGKIKRLEEWVQIIPPEQGSLYGDSSGVTYIQSERFAMQLAIEAISEFTCIYIVLPDYCYLFKDNIPKEPSIYWKANHGKYDCVRDHLKTASRNIGNLIDCLTIGGKIFCTNYLKYRNKKTKEEIESFNLIEYEDGKIQTNLSASFWCGTVEKFNEEWEIV